LVPLILRMTGGRWYVYPSEGSTWVEPNALAVTGTNAAWAGGTWTDAAGGGSSAPVLLRWNGVAWKAASSPLQGGNTTIFGMAAGPSGTAWAVGMRYAASTIAVSMWWNGKDWRRVPVPLPVLVPATLPTVLYGVGSVPGGTGWAVGVANDGQTLIMRWTGKAWALVRSPGTEKNPEFLYSVAATSPRDAWAVGTRPGGTVILHWNGRTWS